MNQSAEVSKTVRAVDPHISPLFFPALLLFLGGALLGTLGDFFHVVTQTDGYQSPLYPLPGSGQPFWVPFLFGSAGLGIGLSHPFIGRRLGQKPRMGKSWMDVIAGILAFLFLYACSGFLSLETGGAKDAFLIIGALLVWVIFDRTWQGIVLGLSTALIGTSFEIFLSYIGGFYYYPHAANFAGVPSWLPWLYFPASITVGNAGRFLTLPR